MITIDRSGLKKLRDELSATPDKIAKAESIAVNTAARFGLTRSIDAMREEVNIRPSDLRRKMAIGKFASPGAPEAAIVASFSPYSLANFTRTRVRYGGGQRGVTVQIQKNGGSKEMRRAFFVKLRAGTEGELTNKGLAIRVPAGEQPTGTTRGRLLFEDDYGDTYLLYGPSANQVFFFVREDVSPLIAQKLEDEFFRQLGRQKNV